MGRLATTAKRLALVVVASGVTLVGVVGVVALVNGRSFLHDVVNPVQVTGMLDEERVRLAAKTLGPFAVATDPAVAIIMKRGITRKIFGVDAVMDRYGQRTRVGPMEEPGATRIVVLGDSVAFGFGVENDQTIAHHLEAYLARTIAEGRPRPVVFTVACPGWNNQNACRYLKNHLARLRPDVVLFIPVGNDLHDAYTATEVGHRELHDPSRGTAYPHTSAEQWNLLMMTNYKNAPMSEWVRVRAAGGVNATVPHAVISGLTPESKRRWSCLTRDITDLYRRLESRGVRFAAAFVVDDVYELLFHVAVARELPELPLIWTFGKVGKADRLVGDPHPNPRYTRALAWCLAESVLARGWIPGADSAALPKLADEYVSRRTPPRSLVQAEELRAARLERWAEFFHSEVFLHDTTGFQQVYGAVHADGTVDRTAWLALKNPGKGRINLHIERLPAKLGLYPLTLTLSVNGTVVGELPVPAPVDGEDPHLRHSFAVPEVHSDAKYFDIRVAADNWVVAEIEGMSRIVSFRLVRIGFE